MAVYIFGHKSPDTDSVTSAIALAELQKLMGVDAIPCRQGELNPETKLVIEKFGFPEPELRTDATGLKYMLVDHSDLKQAPDNWDKGELLGVVDHHKIGEVTTPSPIVFWSMPVGCTATVLYWMYKHIYEQPLDSRVAGLMLSAILSDTVLFKSATCTKFDKEVAASLANLAYIDDIMPWGMELAKAKSAVAGVPPRDLLFRDYKDFNMSGKTVGIGQLELVSLDLVADMKEALYAEVQKVKAEGNRHSVFLMLTDIMQEGTELLAATDDASVVQKAFGKALDGRSVWLPGVMSRKKEMVPPLEKAMAG